MYDKFKQKERSEKQALQGQAVQILRLNEKRKMRNKQYKVKQYTI